MGILRQHINNFATTLDGGITAVATTINVTDASALPTDYSNTEVFLTINDGAQIEIVKVTARTANALTVVRAQEGTSGYAFLDLDPIELLVTANSIDRKLDISNGMLSTGLQTGGLVTINADTTKFDVSAGSGQVVDNYTDPENPVVTNVIWSAFTAQTVTNIATTQNTHVAINSAGAIAQQEDHWTSAEIRDLIVLGNLFHPDNINVTDTDSTPVVTFDSHLSFADLNNVIGSMNADGNVYSANGANLNIDKSAGSIYRQGINYKNSKQNPNTATNAAGTALSFFYTYRDGAGGFTTSASTALIDPNNYDTDTGTPTTIPGSNNYTIQKIWVLPNNTTYIMYGQELFATLAEALASVGGETFSADPFLLSEGLFRGWLIVKDGTTDLTNISNAKFIAADKFGAAAAGGISTSTTTLQQAYDNSAEPEITLTATRGALNVADNATPIAATLFSVSNNGSTINYFASDDDGAYVHTEDTRTNSVDYNVTLTATTTGTPAAGIGTGMLFRAESADENPSEFGAINFTATDVGAGTEDTDFVIRTRVAGAALSNAYKMRVTGVSNYIFTGAPTAERTVTFPDADLDISSGQVQITNGGTGVSAIPKARAYRSGSQAITTATFTKVQLNLETFDTNSDFDSTTNYRFTPTVAGKYLVCATGTFSFAAGDTNVDFAVDIYKNGAVVAQAEGRNTVETIPNSMSLSDIVDMNGSTDYLELFVYHAAGANRNIVGSSSATYMSATLIP